MTFTIDSLHWHCATGGQPARFSRSSISSQTVQSTKRFLVGRSSVPALWFLHSRWSKYAISRCLTTVLCISVPVLPLNGALAFRKQSSFASLINLLYAVTAWLVNNFMLY